MAAVKGLWIIIMLVGLNVYEIGGESVYLVRYMSNNHVVAHHLEIES